MFERSHSEPVAESPHKAGRVISVEGLCKRYRIHTTPGEGLRAALLNRRSGREVVALDGINFRVDRGERVGVVGANGAGKSTLLKVLSGVLDPSEGRAVVSERRRGILELGVGFAEDCTGRQNIELGGLCMGLSRSEVSQCMDWILDFSELSDVIDRPFRTYSAGMKQRLMYAVAFCRPVGVMIIDEALATGDGAFVQKCTSHIAEVCRLGTTALITSHNLYLLERLCDRVLYLVDGCLKVDGDAREVCALYRNDLAREFAGQPLVSEKRLQEVEPRPNRLRLVNGSGSILGTDGKWTPFDFTGAPPVRAMQLVRLRESQLVGSDGEPTDRITSSTPARFRFVVESRVRKASVHVGFMIWRDGGRHVATTTNVIALGRGGRSNFTCQDLSEGVFSVEVEIPSLRLAAGSYHLTFGVTAGPEHFSDEDPLVYEKRCLEFVVVGSSPRQRNGVDAVFHLPAVWRSRNAERAIHRNLANPTLAIQAVRNWGRRSEQTGPASVGALSGSAPAGGRSE